MPESKSSEEIFRDASYIAAQQNSQDKYNQKLREKLEKFEQKIGNRIVDKSWYEIKYYRKFRFIYILGAVGFMMGLLFILAPIILFIIWKTGPTYSKRNFGNDFIIYKHRKYTLLVAVSLMLLSHIISIGYFFYTGFY